MVEGDIFIQNTTSYTIFREREGWVGVEGVDCNHIHHTHTHTHTHTPKEPHDRAVSMCSVVVISSNRDDGYHVNATHPSGDPAGVNLTLPFNLLDLTVHPC